MHQRTRLILAGTVNDGERLNQLVRLGADEILEHGIANTLACSA